MVLFQKCWHNVNIEPFNPPLFTAPSHPYPPTAFFSLLRERFIFLHLWLMDGPLFVGRMARSRLISAQEQWGRDRALYLSVTQAIFREMCQRQAERWTTGWRRNTSHSIYHSPLLSVGVDIRLDRNDSKNSLRMTNYNSIKLNQQSRAMFTLLNHFITFPIPHYFCPYVIKIDVSCHYHDLPDPN